MTSNKTMSVACTGVATPKIQQYEIKQVAAVNSDARIVAKLIF